MFKKILEKIKEYNRVIIHHHIRPDGDCIGSQMGMKHLLKATYPEKEIYAVGGDVPPYLEYIAEHDVVADWRQDSGSSRQKFFPKTGSSAGLGTGQMVFAFSISHGAMARSVAGGGVQT